MAAARERSGRVNAQCRLVSPEAHSAIFAIIGPQANIRAIGLADLFSNPDPDWQKIGCGAVCYVRDYEKKCVTLRLFDVDDSVEESWSSIVPSSATFEQQTANFLVYHDDEGLQLGISFADDEEASAFFESVTRLQQKRANMANDWRRPNSTSTVSPLPSPLPLMNLQGQNDRFRRTNFVPVDPNPNIPQMQSVEAHGTTTARRAVEHIQSGVRSKLVKWNQDGSFRRVKLSWSDDSPEDLYEVLLYEIRNFAPNFKGFLSWKDRDGDLIDFSTDAELRSALDECDDLPYFTIYIREERGKATDRKKSKTNAGEQSGSNAFDGILSSFSSVMPKFEKSPPPIDKMDISNPKNFRHVVHLGSTYSPAESNAGRANAIRPLPAPKISHTQHESFVTRGGRGSYSVSDSPINRRSADYGEGEAARRSGVRSPLGENTRTPKPINMTQQRPTAPVPSMASRRSVGSVRPAMGARPPLPQSGPGVNRVRSQARRGDLEARLINELQAQDVRNRRRYSDDYYDD